MAKKGKFNYFDAFEQQIEIALEESEILVEAIENFESADKLEDILKRAHEIEHKGDQVNHAIHASVSVDFITPIERADILELAGRIDDVTDIIEGVLQRFYMFNIHFMHDDAIEFAHIINKSLKALRKSMENFREFKKVKKIRAMITDVKDLEEEADALYMNSIRKLYTVENEDAVRVEVWSRLFDRLEAACDACDAVGDTMADIVLKNV